MNFAGKIVLITGAASGIGAATATKFAQLGACLALTDINDKNLKEIAKKCAEASKSEPKLFVGDISREGDRENLWKETLDHYGRLDVLVNNAGIMEMGSIEKTSLEQFDRAICINLRSMYHLTMLAVPELIKSKGNIVNTSSVCGLRAFENLVAYNISKSGVDQFTRSVALDLGPKGVRSNCVNPGVIVTNLQKSGGMDEKAYAELLERAKKTHPIGRPGQPHEVANAITFLASDLASFITGVTLSVDGGKQVLCPR